MQYGDRVYNFSISKANIQRNGSPILVGEREKKEEETKTYVQLIVRHRRTPLLFSQTFFSPTSGLAIAGCGSKLKR